jgi:hypothetical protein
VAARGFAGGERVKMQNVKRSAFKLSLTFLLTLALVSTSFACSGPGGRFAIILNGFMSRGYGHVSAILAAGTLYLQFRRSGLSKTSIGLALLFILIYFSNPGWHYSGIHGDCGYQELDEARTAIFYVGALLAWQVIATLRLIWRQKASTQS